MTGAQFDDAMRTLAARFAFSETSARRSKKHNQEVGGMPNSRHLLGLARDVVLDDESDEMEFKADARRMGLTVVDEVDHLHVQTP